MKRFLGKLAIEIGVVCAIGVVAGFAVNGLRADNNNVAISRNYFPRLTIAPAEPVDEPTSDGASGSGEATAKADDAPSTGGGGAQYDPANLGVRVVSFEQVETIYYDEKTDMGLNVFVDARDDEQFNHGHIPGAIQVDHYRVDNYLPDALPLIESAEQVVVYCTGGDCEDSFFLCQTLIDNNVPPDKLRVFKGGMEAWEENDMQIETGEGV